MKLLSLRLCEHDSNISYWDGAELHYFKSERGYKEKHHGYQLNIGYAGSKRRSEVYDWVLDILDLWDIDLRNMDPNCIIIDQWLDYNNGSILEPGESFFPVKYCESNTDVLKDTIRWNHHYAHALSAQFLYGESDLDFVIDGVGDGNNVWSVFKKTERLAVGIGESKDNSLGMQMNKIGFYLDPELRSAGIDAAGKTMGLQSYGNVDKTYYNKLKSLKIENVDRIFSYDNWVNHIGEDKVAKLKRLDWVRTVHEVMGDVLLEFFKRYANKYDKITYSGGVAQNVIWNTKLKNEFPNLFIPPYPGDEGLSIGGIEFLRRKYNLPKMSLPNFPFSQSDEGTELPSTETIKQTAEALAENKIVAWYQGNGEIGPRALGNRSILMNPLVEDGKNKINSVKRREGYRPFGAVVLDEYKQDYFEVNQDFDNPYMLYVANVKDKRLKCITHVDGTCRIQTLKNENPVLRSLMEEFYKLTGCPILLNTSLNLAGKPIAAYREDVYELLRTTSIDIGVVGDTIINNSNVPV